MEQKKRTKMAPTKRLCSWLMFLVLLFIFPPTAMAALAAQVDLEIVQIFITSTGAGYHTADEVEYTLAPGDPSYPMPAGSTGGKYITSVQGNAVATITIMADTAGTYTYTLTEQVPSPFNYSWATQTYEITVKVSNMGEALVVIKNAQGYKCEQMEWQYIYKANGGTSPGDTENSSSSDSGSDSSRDDNAPQTGDGSNPQFWLALCVLSGFALFLCILPRGTWRGQDE